MARVAVTLAVFAICIAVALGVIPKNKMYFSIPLSPVAATTAASAATTAASNTTTNSTATTAATTSSGAAINFIPLGQVLGNLLVGFFGAFPNAPNAINVGPLGSLIGQLLQSIFGAGWTPSG